MLNDKMLKIIPATIKDANLITKIKTKAYDDEMVNFGPDHDISEIWGPQWYSDPKGTERLISEFYYYKILVDNDVIGCFWLQTVGEDAVELEDFCILPEFQNKGYGLRSLIEMESLFPDKKKWILGTPYYSIKNHYLYEKAGYVKIGESENKVCIFV